MTRESKKQSFDDAVTAPVLARWLGVSGKTAYELAKAGIVVRAGRGLYKLEESVTRYCAHTRRTAAQRGGEASLEAMREERIRIAREQADALALKNKAARGEMLDAAAVEAGLASECPSSNALGQTAAFGTEALARLGLRLGSFQPMLQSSQFDGVAFDPFSLQKDGLASAEVDVGRR